MKKTCNEIVTIKSTSESPRVIFTDEGKLIIEGNIICKKPEEVFAKIKEGIRNVCTMRLDITLKLDLLNSRAMQELIRFFRELERVSGSKRVRIYWYFFNDDMLNMEAGVAITEMFQNLNIILLQYDEHKQKIQSYNNNSVHI